MIKPFRLYFLCLALTLVFSQCSEQGGRNLPRHSGAPGEVLVVMNESQWREAPGDSLRAQLEAPYPQLPQREASFSLLQFSQQEMSDLLRHHRNIVQVILGEEAEGDTAITVAKDKWSSNQLVFTIKAPTYDAFYDLLNNQMERVTSMLNNKEMERTSRLLKARPNESLQSDIRTKFSISMVLQDEFEKVKSERDFLWLQRERIKYKGNVAHEIVQGIFIYRFPYTSDTVLSPGYLLAQRDSVLKKYVPGPKKGTYMATEYRYYPPLTEVLNQNERYTLLTRGLWKTENYFMGGPFISIASTSNDNSEVIVVSGYVFAPKFDKREYVRELEAILRSVQFENEAS